MAIVIDRSAERAAERERDRLLAREREARRDAELAAGRATRLQRVTSAVSAATTAEEIGRVTLEQAMQALSAPAGTLAFPEGSQLKLTHARGYAPDSEAEWQRFPLDAPAPLAEVIRTGQPVILERREDWAAYPDLARTIERYEAFAGVPFAFGGVVLGGMALSFTGPRLVSAPERGFLVALGRLAAQALERTRLFEQRGYVARTLQQGLLPDRLADAPGLEVAIRYHSIADGGEVGGDFYDFFDVAPDRWVAATGDVAGKGTAAAVLTGLARHTLRAIALREESPATMLRFLDEAIRRQSSPSAFCTVGCAAIGRAPDGFHAVLASGGHPHPVLVRAGGRAEEVEVRGTLLGVQPDPPLEEVAVDLRPGDVLMSYTDGVTDARDAAGGRFGEERLLEAVDAAVTAGAHSAEDMAEALDATVRGFEDERRRDDRAILVIRVCP